MIFRTKLFAKDQPLLLWHCHLQGTQSSGHALHPPCNDAHEEHVAYKTRVHVEAASAIADHPTKRVTTSRSARRNCAIAAGTTVPRLVRGGCTAPRLRSPATTGVLGSSSLAPRGPKPGSRHPSRECAGPWVEPLRRARDGAHGPAARRGLAPPSCAQRRGSGASSRGGGVSGGNSSDAAPSDASCGAATPCRDSTSGTRASPRGRVAVWPCSTSGEARTNNR